ncbi:CopG family transcriptional regulator [Halorussus limi]|uniref:CopG family transcriptional regulator n=1 Tax=Halorussus limi TaxID=2938695 RepID=A0A8U0HXI4_9EURY|nr:CopG family transcriptional regulator [Halorussus limi]UPV75274.1 CopG family transcriptional regulator [Halorussus limi]
MKHRYSITCERERARRIETLAREYDLTTQEVLQQLIEVGLEEIETDE